MKHRNTVHPENQFLCQDLGGGTVLSDVSPTFVFLRLDAACSDRRNKILRFPFKNRM